MKDIEVQITLTAGNKKDVNIDLKRQFILRNSHNSPKLPRHTPLLGGSPILVQREDKIYPVSIEEKKEILKPLPSIREVDSNPNTPELSRRKISAPLKPPPKSRFRTQMSLPLEENKEASVEIKQHEQPSEIEATSLSKEGLETLETTFNSKKEDLNSEFNYKSKETANVITAANESARKNNHVIGDCNVKSYGDKAMDITAQSNKIQSAKRGRKSGSLRPIKRDNNLEEEKSDTGREKRNKSLTLFKDLEQPDNTDSLPSRTKYKIISLRFPKIYYLCFFSSEKRPTNSSVEGNETLKKPVHKAQRSDNLQAASFTKGRKFLENDEEEEDKRDVSTDYDFPLQRKERKYWTDKDQSYITPKRVREAMFAEDHFQLNSYVNSQDKKEALRPRLISYIEGKYLESPHIRGYFSDTYRKSFGAKLK